MYTNTALVVYADVTNTASYVQLHAQLTRLNELRNRSRQKLNRYRYLQRLLKPFDNPSENVQPNLVYVSHEGSGNANKAGKELERELVKMREQLAKVEGGVKVLKQSEQFQRRETDEMTEEFGIVDDEIERSKVEKILQRGS